MRWIRLGLVSLVLAAGCTSSSDRAEVPPPELPGPGTPLRNGFTVAEGTRLLGAVWTWPEVEPPDDRVVPEDQWKATLIVDGDPFDVYEAYLDQATDLGFEVERQGHGCVFSYSAGGARIAGVRCSFSAGVVSGGSTVESVAVDVTRTVDGNVRWASHVDILYQHWVPGAERPIVVAPPFGPVPPVTGPERAVLESPEPPPVPAEGERIGDGLDDTEPLVVAPGSRPVAPVRTDVFEGGGYDAVLEVTGDLDAVLSNYARQIRAWGTAVGFESATALVDGHEVRTMYDYQAGGGGTELIAVVGRGDDPTYLRITLGRLS